MGRKKLIRFAEMKNFSNVFEPPIGKDEVFAYKGKWNSDVFKNTNPIVLELGCGKGEYTVELATLFPNKNYIGVEIKGARMYVGAKKAIHNNLTNVAFLRTRIELIENFFAKNEIDEIWLTFPDPQPKKKWSKKRLTSSYFLNKYLHITKPDAIFHLKTDSLFLYHYTLSLLQKNNVNIIYNTSNVYETNILDNIQHIKTHYENIFTSKGYKITYIRWQLSAKEIIELSDEEYQEIEKHYLGSTF
ncbi:MAG: tRNA (guanosine(46)-N7)-methyltransferase TrmB [Bacteroidales bacterium]